ncbi:MAG: serine O-acetyltransferase [Cyanobacteria bacterium P01_E01_bin.45]
MVDPINYSEVAGEQRSEYSQPVPPPANQQEDQLNWWQGFLEDIDCVFERDPAARNRMEVLLTYPGLHALLSHRIGHWLWQHRCKLLARYISSFVRWLTLIEIHPGARIGRRFFIDHGAGVVIGETTLIGNDVTLYHGVTLGGTSWDKGKRHPTLRDGVVIGAGAKVLGPISIGKGARVGANSVVVKDVPAEMSVVGIPGRVVLPIHCRRITEHGIDLDHHLMPDPVGKAISSLIGRIDGLEQELRELKGEDAGDVQPDGEVTSASGATAASSATSTSDMASGSNGTKQSKPDCPELDPEQEPYIPSESTTSPN